MKSSSFLKALTVVSTLVTSSAFADTAKTVVQNAIDAGQFKTLVALVDKAGLVGTLSGAGPFTVFAPTDAAFAKVSPDTLTALGNNPEALRKLLLQHVAAGTFTGDRIALRKDVKTLGGAVACTYSSRCSYQGNIVLSSLGMDGRLGAPVRITSEDIVSSNGIIQVIDTVLLPAASSH